MGLQRLRRAIEAYNQGLISAWKAADSLSPALALHRHLERARNRIQNIRGRPGRDD